MCPAAGQYSEQLTELRGQLAVECLAHQREGIELLQCALQDACPRRFEPQARDVPRVEAPQVADGARHADVLDRRTDHPVELGQHLVRPRRRIAQPEQLLEQPRVAERAAREHDRRDTGLPVGVANRVGAVQAAAQQHRCVERPHELGGERVIGPPAMRERRRTRMQCDRHDAGLV